MDKPVRLNRTGMKTACRIEKKSNKEEQEYGTPVKDWIDCGVRVYAKVQSISGREADFARTLMATSTHRVTIPFIPNLREQHRFIVQKNGRVLEIGHINNVEMQDVKLICLCEEIGTA